MNDLSIYLHWPFCKSRCPYCDFMSVPENDKKKYEEFSEYLFLDLKNSLKELNSPFIKTIFFGGGTPSLMNPKSIEKIINFIYKNYEVDSEIEISLEANPATFSEQKLEDFRLAGINRLSLGIQSFQDENLKFLGRIYNSNQAMKSAEIVAKVFHNFSFDFIYGYQPKFNLKKSNAEIISDFEKDLISAMNFNCKHVSCYQLTIEENTPFFHLLREKKIHPIEEFSEIELFKFIKNFLAKYKIHRYEISNYALNGYESKHNLAYWKYQNYLGVGPSAHGRISEKLFFEKNNSDRKIELKKFHFPNEWKEKILTDQSTYEIENILTEQEQLEEIFIMGLRLSEGINLENLRKQFAPNLLNPIFEKIKILTQKSLFEISKKFLKLSDDGLLKQNSIIEFLFN